MTRNEVALGELLAVRERLRAELPSAVSEPQKRFLITLATRQPRGGSRGRREAERIVQGLKMISRLEEQGLIRYEADSL